MFETAAALGHLPVAGTEMIAFRRVAAVPVPPDVVDLGLRGAPNLEALSLIAPDLVLSSSNYSFVEPQLERIAPVFTRALFVPGENPFPKMMALFADLAGRLGDAPAGARAIAAAEAAFAALARRAAPFADRPCCLINVGDMRHVRIFGDDSLFDGALKAIGLTNAWAGGTQFAFAAPVPIEALAAYPEARFVLVGEVPVQARRALAEGALWNSLPPVRNGRVHHLPEMDGFGAVPSALAFATALVAALEAQG